MRTLLAALASLSFVLLACSGDDGTGAAIDAATDSPPGTVDAAVDAPAGSSALGRACMGNDQGNCPTGWLCIQLTGGTSRWCSKTCTSEQDMSCEEDYTGPGFARCLFNVDFGGGVSRIMCGIACDDPPGGPMICPFGMTQCNGTCPQPLMCTANLTSTNGQVIGRACR
jgi:hypothetical protein